jgi:cystathionine beta-lyase/cystathionine gamma-synthase
LPSLRIWAVESLAELPTWVTHASILQSDEVLCLTCGIEEVEDLLDDVRGGLEDEE